jgi:hypothetical protein
MMSWWEINGEILRGRYPGLLEEICKDDDALAPEDIRIEPAASGAPALTLKGLHVHSPRDPGREGRRLAETVYAPGAGNAQAKDGEPVIILGFGLGYAALAAAELAPGRPLIIVEKYRALLRKALEVCDLRDLLLKNNIVFVPGGSGDGIIRALSMFRGKDGSKSPPVIRNRALVNLDEEWYASVESHIRAWAAKDNVNMATLRRFGRRWVRNLAHNMSAIRDLPGISRLAGLAADGAVLPVFLAAAGPGLDRAGPLLAEIRRRCVVVAVDTSLRFLLRRSVEPDFVLVVDPQFWNSRHLDRCSVSRTRLVAESAVYPPVLRLPFRGAFLCGSLFPLGNFIEQRVDPKGPLGAGGSVATTAWDFARTLGARDIWIAGLDLAFPGLKTHFRGALFEDRALAESERLGPAETWLFRALRDGRPFYAPAAGGGQVLTDHRLSLYAAWFESRFRRFPQVRSHSLSGGGLAIAGLETAGGADLLALPVLREEIDRRLEAAFSRIEADFFAPQAAVDRAGRYENAVASLLCGLESVKAAAEKGAQTVERALRRNPPPAERDNILAVLDKITQAIAQSEVKEVAGFLFPPGETADGSERENGPVPPDPFRAYLESSARFYGSLAQAAEYHLRALT